MNLVRKDEEGGNYRLLNLEQVTRVTVTEEQEPGGLKLAVHLSDGGREGFEGDAARRLLEQLESREGGHATA